MDWAVIMDLDDLQTDVYANGWTPEYKSRLRRLCPDCGLEETDSDDVYQMVLDTKNMVSVEE